MPGILHCVVYACAAVFVAAVGWRFYKIQTLPIHLRWELYPVPTEGKRAEHGGSRLEEVDWWTKAHRPDWLRELRFMFSEMILIKALFEHNRKLWRWSFPFHFGLYLTAGWGALLVLGALLELGGLKVGAGAGGLGAALSGLTVAVGVCGMALGIVGGLGLLRARLTDEDMKPYTNFSHYFNLLFIAGALALTLAAWAAADRDFSLFRRWAASALSLNLSAHAGSRWVSGSILVLALLAAYVPLTHMSHFFVKWFTWHRIRWDDEPNVKGGRIEIMIQKALQYPVSWSAEHVNADGKKTWADIATEEMK
jgi:nitrate reductase gamma subunit